MAILIKLVGAMSLVSGTSVAADGPPNFVPVQKDMLAVSSQTNSWADFDNDGDLDLAASLSGGGIRLYRNDAGTLVSVGQDLGLPTAGGEIRALAWGDYDGDGWIDLFAGPALKGDSSALFRNMAGKRFVDVAAEKGLTMPGRSSRQNNWIDYDNDGDLDLYATDRSGANMLFRNDGGVFTQVFIGKGPSDTRATIGACWFDYDKDGDLDMFLANQSGDTDALWRNDKTQFVDVAPQLGVDRPGRTEEEGSVGCAIGDYNGDGNLDIFVASYGRNVLWRHNGNGTFTNVAEVTGVGIENHAVGAAWGDYDNDGFPDLAVMSYEGPPTRTYEGPSSHVPHNSLFHNDGGKRFTNVIGRDSPINAGDHGVAWVDFDQDGAIDLSVTRGFDTDGGHFVFRNALPRPNAGRSLSVLVLDAHGRYTQAGAEVRLYDRRGRILGTGQVSTGGGYNAQGATPVHFGLPSRTPVTVEVTFMSAQGQKKQRVRNVVPSRYAGKSLIVRRGV